MILGDFKCQLNDKRVLNIMVYSLMKFNNKGINNWEF